MTGSPALQYYTMYGSTMKQTFFKVLVKVKLLTLMLCHCVDILHGALFNFVGPLNMVTEFRFYEVPHKIMQFLSVHWVTCPEMSALTGG
jgi:hypothetical protein